MFDNELSIQLASALSQIFLDIETIKDVLLKNNIVSQEEFKEIREMISSTGKIKEFLDELNDLKERMK